MGVGEESPSLNDQAVKRILEEGAGELISKAHRPKILCNYRISYFTMVSTGMDVLH